MSTRNKTKAFLIAALYLAAFAGNAFFAKTHAAEIQFPTYGYAGDELKKLKEWERHWVGRKITTENADQVKDFLHEAVYSALKSPRTFGAESLWFEIVPYRPYIVSPGMIAATKKYAPASKLTTEQVLVHYGEAAGIPFPRPKTGAEMAWNFDGNTRGDSHHEFVSGPVVDCSTGHERKAGMLRWELYWIGRYDVPPVPKIPETDNRRGIARSYFSRHTEPPDFVDTTILELKYQDITREEDLWIYTAMFRRIRRYATSQRTDSIDGTDMIYDDQDGWYTHLIHNNYLYKGRAEYLVARHQNSSNLQKIRGQGFWNGVQRERVNHWVIEVTNKDKDYIYSKQIWYLDPETWQLNFKVMYNRQGELWKMYELFYDEFPSYGGGTTAIYTSEQIVDFIRRHGSVSIREMKGVGIEIPLHLFQTRSLKDRSY
ncbi:DUF1329 domain-containing protein [Thermodesulfobacteriota bacterium]